MTNRSMETKIHPTAIIEEGAEIGEGCRIGPFAIIEAGAKIGPDNEFGAGSHVSGFVEMGNGNRLMRGASLGGEPQSKKYQGETTWLKVGDGNWFGENTVVNRGTADKGVTTIGNHLFMMNGSHCPSPRIRSRKPRFRIRGDGQWQPSHARSLPGR